MPVLSWSKGTQMSSPVLLSLPKEANNGFYLEPAFPPGVARPLNRAGRELTLELSSIIVEHRRSVTPLAPALRRLVNLH